MAEVLITLLIIGVVAVLTISTLVSQIEKAVLKNQFKKFVSTFKQAVMSVQMQETRPLRCYYWDSDNPYSGVCTETCDDEDRDEYGSCTPGTQYCKETGEPLPSNIMGYFSDCQSFHEQLFLKTLKLQKYCKNNAYENGCLPKDIRGVDKVQKENNPDQDFDPNKDFSDSKIKNQYPVYILADGTYLIGHSTFLGKIPMYVVDINGFKGPNKWGHDIFMFKITGNVQKGITSLSRHGWLVEKGGVTFETMLKEVGLGK